MSAAERDDFVDNLNRSKWLTEKRSTDRWRDLMLAKLVWLLGVDKFAKGKAPTLESLLPSYLKAKRAPSPSRAEVEAKIRKAGELKRAEKRKQ